MQKFSVKSPPNHSLSQILAAEAFSPIHSSPSTFWTVGERKMTEKATDGTSRGTVDSLSAEAVRRVAKRIRGKVMGISMGYVVLI